MTTHLRARTAQAGAFLALVVGVLTGIQAPALADNPTVTIDRISPTTVASGSTVTMRFTVSDPGPGEETVEPELDITVSGMTCGCNSRERIDGTKSFEVTLTAPTVATGQTRDVSITVSAKRRANSDSATDSESVKVEGPAAPTTVRQVSGRIKDNNNKRVSGVQVVMKDSAGHQYQTTTNGEGGYSFTSSDSQPIAAGSIQIAAAKEGFEPANVSVQGTAGRTVNVPLTLKKTAVPTSPTPSASSSPSAAATEPAAEEEETSEEETQGINLGADPEEAANTTEDEGTNWLLIAMGGLLVAAGIGAMVLVMMRRKRADEISSDTGLGTAVPAAAGGFDATRVAAPVGAGRGGDATMIAPAAGMGAGLGAGLADAPTMIHRPAAPVEDEFPDPYGAPLPPGGGYGGGNQWDGQQGGNYGGGDYGATQTYGQQQGGAGYGAPGGQQRYDEHTGMYQPEQPQRYDEHTSMYQPEQGGDFGGGNYGGGYGQAGYDQQQGGYEQGWNGQDAGGYGPQGGYDQQAPQGGYPQQGGNYGGGYGPQGGYDQQAPQGGYPQQGGNYGGGYDQQQPGGYPQQGGGTYGNNNPQRPNRDWMDD